MKLSKEKPKTIYKSSSLGVSFFTIISLFIGSCTSPTNPLSENKTLLKNQLTPETESIIPVASKSLSNATDTGKNKLMPKTNTTKTIIKEETFESNTQETKLTRESSSNQNISDDAARSNSVKKTKPFASFSEDEQSNIQVAKKPPFFTTHELQDIFFDYDAFKLDKKSKDILRKNAEWLNQNPTIKFELEGHSDERGTNNYNLGLGQKRALSVKHFLEVLGVESSRAFTISYGEEKPFCFKKSDQCWKQNRRTHFLISQSS